MVGNGACSKSAHMVAASTVQDAATLRLRLESLQRASAQGPERRIEDLFRAVPFRGRRLVADRPIDSLRSILPRVQSDLHPLRTMLRSISKVRSERGPRAGALGV
jgi:hypothetical protein